MFRCQVLIAVALTLVTMATLAPAVLAQTELTENTLRRDEGAPRPEGSVESLAFLAGLWRGEGLGGLVEEVWAPPSAGTMMGAFKLYEKGEPSFYELMLIVEKEDGLALELKHFNPDLTGWEEKGDFVTFELVKLGENEAYFDGLTYRRTGDELRVFLAMRRKDGLHEVPFVMHRVAD